MTSQPAHASDTPLVLASDVRHSGMLAGSAAPVQLPRQQPDPPQLKLPNPFAAQPVARYACTFVSTALLPILAQQLLLAVLQGVPQFGGCKAGVGAGPVQNSASQQSPANCYLSGCISGSTARRPHIPTAAAPGQVRWRRRTCCSVRAWRPRKRSEVGARRANVVTEDLDKLFAKRKARQKPPTKPG